ncbi:MAG: hypothetical protein M3347_03155 [Armatimonadota bacterium]|nr:hypothetical protein [Armatimonadota bacterium]
MPRAIVDPEELRRFAAYLEQTTADLRGQKTNTIAGFARLHDTWRDEKYSRFEQVFTESMQLLELYLRQSEQYANFCKQKAARAQRYLDQR